MELDFKKLKRKDLQRLCKKHGLRANSTNSQMADSLASFSKVHGETKQAKVRFRGSGERSGKEGETVEEHAERILIILDEEEDEFGTILKSGSKLIYSSENHRDSGVIGDSEGAKVPLREENPISFLQNEDEELDPVLRSAKWKNGGSSSMISQSGKSNDKKQPTSDFQSSNEGRIVPVGLAKSSTTGLEVAQVEVNEFKQTRSREVVRQNAELSLASSKSENSSVEINEETSMVETGNAHTKRKRYSMDSSKKVKVGPVFSLPITGGVPEEHQNTRVDSATAFFIDKEKEKRDIDLQNEQELEELEPKKRTRGDLEVENSAMEKDVEEIAHAQLPVFVQTDELVKPETDLTCSQLVGSGEPSNLVSSRQRLLLSELREEEVPGTNEPLREHRNEELELGESLICRSSVIAGVTMMEVEGTFGGRLFILETDNDSKYEVTQPSSAASLSFLKDDSKGEYKACSTYANHVKESDGSCKQSFISEEFHRRSRAGTPVLRHDLCLSSEQGCETLETDVAENRGIKLRQGYQERDKDKEKRDKSFEENEYHKVNQNKNECQGHIFVDKSEKSESLPVSQRVAEINCEQIVEPSESATLVDELPMIKDGEPFGLDDRNQIIGSKLRNEEKLCGSDQPSTALVYDKDSEANTITGGCTEKMQEIAPFGFGKRVDNLLEKVLYLRKVLRGEATPPVKDSSLRGEEEIFPDESSSTSTKERVSEQESEVVETMLLTNLVHEDCELNGPNNETLEGLYSVPIEQECANKLADALEVESQNSCISRTDAFAVAMFSELKASKSTNIVDPVEEINHNLINFCISCSRKPTNSIISNTPRTRSTGTFKPHSSTGIIRNKENTQSTELKCSSCKRKMRTSSSARSIRRPLRSVTNQMLD